MAAVKPMMQQPGAAKPNSSYNNNNQRSAAPSMQQELSVAQVPPSASAYTQHISTCQRVLKATSGTPPISMERAPL